MSNLKSELAENGLLFPDFKNSNMEVFNEFAAGNGRMIGKPEKSIMLLIDGLGFDLLNEVIEKDNLLSKTFNDADISKINTVFPSYTPTVITTLESGLFVGEHGIVGSPIPVREYGEMVNVFEKGWGITERELSMPDTYTLFPHMKNIEKLGKNSSFAYLQDEVVFKKNSSIIDFKNLGDRFKEYISQRDFFIQLRKLVRNKNYNSIYGYLDKIDHAQHVYSKSSAEAKELMKYLLEDIATHLLPEIKEHGWSLFITADHGHVSFKKEHVSTIYGTDKLVTYMNTAPWGCSRAAFVSIIPEMENKFKDELEKRFKEKYILLDSNDAIKEGLFGSKGVPEKLRYRFGSHIIIPKDNNYFIYKYPYQKEKDRELFGSHGGMSKEEMEIPLIKFA